MKSKRKKLLLVGGIVIVILGIYAYLVFSSWSPKSGVLYEPNTIAITEGTQGLKNNLSIGVMSIQDGSGVISIHSKTNSTTKNVKIGDNFDFQNYHIQILDIKKNTKILPMGWTGGSNGFITLRITEK